MAHNDNRPPFLKAESWRALDVEERTAIKRLIADVIGARRARDAARREVDGLREVAKRMDERVRGLSQRIHAMQDARDPTPAPALVREAAQGLRELETFSDELMDEITSEHTTTPPSAPPRVRRQRQVSIEAIDTERARVHLVTEVTLTTATGEVFTGFSENVSAGGVFVAMWDPPPIGTDVRMDLELPDVGPVSVRGSIRWHRTASNGRRTGCGVSFHPSEKELVAAVGRLVLDSYEPSGRTHVQVEDIP